MKTDINYPELSIGELNKIACDLKAEGVDGVYLDRREFIAFRDSLLDKVNLIGVSDQRKREVEFIIYRGIEFRIVESGRLSK